MALGSMFQLGLLSRGSLLSSVSQTLSRTHSTASLQVFSGCRTVHRPPHLLLPSRTVILLTTLKLVDNSENARRGKKADKPYCIKLPKNNKVGKFGDIIKVAHLGKVHNALLVSNKKVSKSLPRYDHHQIILLNDKREPVGTRILGPVPSALRKKEGQYSKFAALATRFI